MLRSSAVLINSKLMRKQTVEPVFNYHIIELSYYHIRLYPANQVTLYHRT
jgi:hypothetical protein